MIFPIHTKGAKRKHFFHAGKLLPVNSEKGYIINMKKIFILLVSVAAFCCILIVSGCGRNKNNPTGTTNALDTTLPQILPSDTAKSTFTTKDSETYEYTESTTVSEFTDSYEGNLESTADTLPSPTK